MAKPPAKDGVTVLGEALDAAQPRRRRPANDEGDRNNGGRYKPTIGPMYGVPDGCPVQPLGVDGDDFLMIDAVRQLSRLTQRDFGSHGLSRLFGDQKGQLWLDQAWPRLNKDGLPIGLDKDRAARSLMAACAEKGVFDADNKIRGVGAWTDADGNMLWHLGDTVLVVKPSGSQHFANPGAIGDHVYPLGAPQPRPGVSDEMSDGQAVDRLYTLLKSWPFRRGKLDARLLLGFAGCALIGGALAWRPALWATGGQGTGKSTLHNDLLHPILGGDGSVVQTSDATGAGIHQTIRNRSTPVLFDELEPNPRARARVENVINLARQAASGGRIVRGSADGGHAREFVARVCFMFSSILMPRLEPQDAMRICVLDLGDLGGRPEPKLDPRDMAKIGRALRFRLVARWQHWPERLTAWRDHVRASGFSSRVAQTWGTLLAMADHLLADEAAIGEPSSDYFDVWIDKLKPYLDALVAAQGSDWARLLQHLLTLSPDAYQRGARWPLSTLIAIASQRESAHEPAVGDLDKAKADAILEGFGMKIILATPPRPKGEADDAPKPTPVWCLAIVSDHSEFNKLLREEKWGAGAYTQTLLRVPGAWSAQQRVARQKVQCAMVPLDIVMPRPETATTLPLT